MGRPRKHRRDLPERVYYKNGAYYYVADNKWKRLSSDYQEAMVAWAALIERPAQSKTIGDLLDRYLLEVVPLKAERTQEDNRREIRYLRSGFGNMAIEEVEPRHVVEYVSKRSALTRANREVALLSHAFNKARLWGLTNRPNPCSVPGTRNRETARDRYVTDDEVEKFKEVCPSWLRNYIELKLLTGLRRGDLLQLSWSDITESSIRVTTNKTGKKLAIQITDEVRVVLNRLSTRSGLLFPNTLGKPYNSNAFNAFWQRMMNEYTSRGNQRFHEHDLRGKVATDIGDAQVAKALLGHKSIKMTEAYIKSRKTDVVQPHTRRK